MEKASRLLISLLYITDLSYENWPRKAWAWDGGSLYWERLVLCFLFSFLEYNFGHDSIMLTKKKYNLLEKCLCVLVFSFLGFRVF